MPRSLQEYVEGRLKLYELVFGLGASEEPFGLRTSQRYCGEMLAGPQSSGNNSAKRDDFIRHKTEFTTDITDSFRFRLFVYSKR